MKLKRVEHICNLNPHKEIKHQGIRFPCDKCEYSAGQLDLSDQGFIKKESGRGLDILVLNVDIQQVTLAA